MRLQCHRSLEKCAIPTPEIVKNSSGSGALVVHCRLRPVFIKCLRLRGDDVL